MATATTTATTTTSSSIPASNNSNSNSNTTTGEQLIIIRPTEAQLRWAQFHHKRRALRVRQRIDALYETPVDLPQGALPEDEKSTTTDDGSTSTSSLDQDPQPQQRTTTHKKRKPKRKRKPKPKVSKGRRAMLRVSRRAQLARKRLIEQHGYQGYCTSSGTLPQTTSAATATATTDDSDDEEDFLWKDMFQQPSQRQRQQHNNRRRLRLLRRRRNKNEDSFKRFQAACHAMMMNLAAPPQPSIVTATRIWQPSSEHRYLDQDYLDVKWGSLRRHDPNDHYSNNSRQNYQFQHQQEWTMDRGASWRVHLPPATAKGNPYLFPYTRTREYYDNANHPPPSSSVISSLPHNDGSDISRHSVSTLAMQAPGAHKFHQLMALVHQRIQMEQEEHNNAKQLPGGPTPKMRLRQQPSLPQNNHGNDNDNDNDNEQLDTSLQQQPLAAGTLPMRMEQQQQQQQQQAPYPMTRTASNMSGRGRKTNYVPRMRLKEFLQDVTDVEYYDDNEEEEEEEEDYRQSPPKMRLKEQFDVIVGGGHPPPVQKRLSKAQELALSFESTPSPKKDGRIRQMAKSLEGDQTDRPKMKLRTSAFGLEEKKMSETFPIQTPRQKQHPMSERFLQHYQEQIQDHHAQQQQTKPGRLSVYTTSTTTSEYCCARCARPSPTCSDVLAQIRQQPNAEDDAAIEIMDHHHPHSSIVPPPPPRESDFFAQVRHQTANDDGTLGTENHNHHAAAAAAAAVPRESDFFAQVRHQNANDDGTSLGTENNNHHAAAVPLRESDFFAQVRHQNVNNDGTSLGTENNNHHAAAVPPRESDFFAQVRHQNSGDAAAPRESDFFANIRQMNAKSDAIIAQVRQMNAKDAIQAGSTRVSGFFNQIRAASTGRTSSGDAASSSRTESDFLARQQTTTTATTKNAAPRESDFFAHVRQQNAKNNVDGNNCGGGGAAVRESDFFAQVRNTNIKRGDQPHLCQECYVHVQNNDDEKGMYNGVPLLTQQQPEDAVEASGGIYDSVSPLNINQLQPANVRTAVDSNVYPIHSQQGEGETTKGENKLTSNAMARFRHSWQPGNHEDEDAKSDNSKETAISELWNRGRSSFNALASSLNAISESAPQNSTVPPTKLTERAANVTNKVVGGLFQSMVGGGQTKDDDGEDYHSALAAFHKSQKEKRESMTTDDSSSQSSYRVLPPDLRQAVKEKIRSPSSMASSQPSKSMPSSRPTVENEKAHSPSSLVSSQPSKPTSPSRSTVTNASMMSVSPEKYKLVHEKVIQNSALGDHQNFIIDTDDTTSEASAAGMHAYKLANLMLSPELLMKRLHQAIRAVEEKRWDQVNYFLHANPWLAEMSEVTTKQYLLHKLAFFGGEAPEDICSHIVDLFPAAAYKFDEDGNVPLHLAAASGHLKMIKLLGEKFESGASIRNEDGMLPLHFSIASYGNASGEATYQDDDNDESPSPLRVVKTVLNFFPQAVAIADNDGNLPIHVAVEWLNGGVAVDIIYLLLDEADRQLQDPFGARFYNKVKLEQLVSDDMSNVSMSTDQETDSAIVDSKVHCNMVKNEFGETPLLSAIRNHKGWEIIEAIAGGPGGRAAALYPDAANNNALHLLVSDFQDPAAAMSIMKIAPETAIMRNSEGVLPIEAACMQLMPEEVILAIALVDLPIDIDDKDGIKVRENFGLSWWFLTCECDDHYVDIVKEVVAICTFQQIRALCFMKGGSSQNKITVISRATPKSRQVLTQALRFVGRFEFVGNEALYSDPKIGLKEFEALDFGDSSSSQEEGRRVLLKCYSEQEPFLTQTAILSDLELNPDYFEKVLTFSVNEDGSQLQGAPQQFCISIECPQLTLDKVVDSMVSNGGYSPDQDLRRKYAAKVCSVLRLIGKAIRHLHASGGIHGNICLENCGKFDHSWRLLGRMDVERIGETISPSRYHSSFPPESLQLDQQEGGICDSDGAPVSFKTSLVADVSLDMWGFGKLTYEAILGKPLVQFDKSKKPRDDVVSLLEVLEWGEFNMKEIFEDLLDSGMPESGADLIVSCLFPRPEDRPGSMDIVLDHPFWKEMRKYRERSKRPKRRDDSVSVFTEGSRSIFTETSEI